MHSCNEMENFQLMVFVNPLSIFLPATDVFLAASQKQESTSREERLSLPQEKSTSQVCTQQMQKKVHLLPAHNTTWSFKILYCR